MLDKNASCIARPTAQSTMGSKSFKVTAIRQSTISGFSL